MEPALEPVPVVVAWRASGAPARPDALAEPAPRFCTSDARPRQHPPARAPVRPPPPRHVTLKSYFVVISLLFNI